MLIENRTAGLLILTSAEVIADRAVEAVADGFHSLCAVDHCCLRRMECFSGIQFIAEIIRVDTHEEAGLSTLVLLCLSQKITAVEEGKTVTFPPGLCSACAASITNGL